LPDTSHADALGLAQTMVQRVQQLRLSHDGVDSGSISVSVGLGTRVAPHNGDAADLLALASDQLQHAKREGRGQLRCASLESAAMPL
jgi:PleD family two-component response regulator